MNPTNKAVAILGNILGSELTRLIRFCLKNKKQNIANNPVLMTGTQIEETIAPTKSFFLNNFITKPATIPATVVFKIQVRIVPIGLIEKNNDIVEGEKITRTPHTSPKNPPTSGPYKIAPIAIGTKDKLILANDGLIKLPTN